MRIALLYCLFLATYNLFAQDFSVYQKRVYVNENGENIPYRIMYPANYQLDSVYPVLLFCMVEEKEAMIMNFN
ncbi:MAG: hypothetical protein HC892_20865 [Saprospiraceae bacterium]|nr:hypothetical protein [Saprospiraceae bacterium]